MGAFGDDRLKYRAIKDDSDDPLRPVSISAEVPKTLKLELNKIRGRRSWAKFLQDVLAILAEEHRST